MSIGADGALIAAEHRGEKPAPDDGMTHLIRVRVENVNAQFERARAHGARMLEPPADREYGERDCTMVDVAGHGGSSPRPFGMWRPRTTAARPSRPARPSWRLTASLTAQDSAGPAAMTHARICLPAALLH